MTKKEFKSIEKVFEANGVRLEVNELFGNMDAVFDYSGAPLVKGQTVTHYCLIPCYPDDDQEDVVEAVVRYADAFDRNVEVSVLYNCQPKGEELSWDTCDKVVIDFMTRINAVADSLSAEYGIERRPDLMSMDASVLEWCEAALFSDEEFPVDPSLTFKVFDAVSERRRIQMCGGDEGLVQTLGLTLETRHDRNLFEYRENQLTEDLLTVINRGTGDWRNRNGRG